jgi:hypothetical protein
MRNFITYTPEGKIPLKDLDVDGTIILQRILEKWNRVRAGFI